MLHSWVVTGRDMFNVPAYKTYNREPNAWWNTLLETSFDRTHTSYVKTCSKFLVNIQVKVQSQQHLEPFLHKCFLLNRFQTHNPCAERYVYEAWKHSHVSTPTCPAFGLVPRALTYLTLLGALSTRWGDPQEGPSRGVRWAVVLAAQWCGTPAPTAAHTHAP